MSRSAPTQNNPNPSTRWLEWKGGDGTLEYYDKQTKEKVTVPPPFKFLVLDQLSTVTGYCEKNEAGIYANEVRDVRADALFVKVFKGGALANGLWEDVKDKVKAAGGKFACSVYIAFRENKSAPLQIGNIKISGCALGPWFDFRKKHQSEINEKAVTIRVGAQEKKGGTKFFPPLFEPSEISAETNAEAVALDAELQEFLAVYLKRPIADKVDQRTGHQPEDENQEYADAEANRKPHPSDPDPDDLPPPSDNDGW